MMALMALLCWIPAVLLVFTVLPPRRAVMVSFLFAWLFLPPTGYAIPGFPDYTKVSATNVGVLFATAMFNLDRLLSFRPRLLDGPMLIWCVCPFATSLSNGLGAYDGLSAAVEHTITWGLPYLIGRLYLTDLRALRELAVLIFVGGLAYMPLCLWEIRMSPNLGHYVYGVAGSGIAYAAELGKWGSRPRVFMGTGLAVGMFMTAASLTGIWLWTTGSLKRLWGFPTSLPVPLLVLTTLGCKNLGALCLLFFGVAALFAVKWFRTRALVYLLIASPVLYMTVRATGRWSATPLVDAAAIVHERRAASMQFRLDNEGLLVAKALMRPVFGWGKWGRARAYREDGRDISVPDGLWVIALGTTGIIGLVAVTSALLLPVLVFLWRYPTRLWVHTAVAPSAALAVLVALYMIDNLFNAMFNPIYVISAGGLVCVAAPHAGLRWSGQS